MPFLIRVWRPEAFAPSAAEPFLEELVLDRERLGPEETTIARGAKAARISPLGDTAAYVSVPASGKPVLVIEGRDFTSLQAHIPPGEEPWKVGPGQLGEPSRLAMAGTASLALLLPLDRDRPGPTHHLVLLPRARVIAPGARELVRANALVIVGKGAIDLRADTTRSTEDAEGDDQEVWSVSIPKHLYHTGLAPLLDAFPTSEPVGMLSLPRQDTEIAPRDLAAASAAIVERKHSAFFPVLEDGHRPRLAFAYKRANGTTGVRLSDTDFHGWLTELGVVLQSRAMPVPMATPALAARSRPLAVFGGIETRSPAFAKVLERAQIFGPTDMSLLLLGQTGTGKEHLAKAIHASSQRKDGPFVAVNCASIPKDLLHSELFGHVKGAFSGAASSRKGAFLDAHGGTLLLDEIGDAPQALQLSLLRVLQDHRVKPVGSDREIAVDVRVLAATSQDLPALMERKLFPLDLYHRLAGAVLVLPSLPERLEDLPVLAAELLRSFASDGRSEPAELTQKALEFLQSFAWRGNVRELATVLFAATTRAKARALPRAAAPGSEADGDPLVIDTGDIDISHATALKPVSRDDLFYFYDAEIKQLGDQIWQEQALPPAGDERRHDRRAKQRAALLYLDEERRPRAEWPDALQSCWNRLFRPGWATAENGRGLGKLLRALSVNVDNKIAMEKAREWLLARVGTEDADFEPKRTVR